MTTISLTTLPEGALINTCSFLSPKDLDNVSRTTKCLDVITKNNLVWNALARKLHCLPLSIKTIDSGRFSQICTYFYSIFTKVAPEKPSQQVREYIFNLKRDIKNLKEALPPDILNIVNSKEPPSFEEIKLLKAYRKTRDLLVVWQTLASLIGQNIPEAKFDSLKSEDIFNNVPKQFDDWFKIHQVELVKQKFLYLQNKKLSSLPKQIGLLIDLETLRLSGNYFTKLPAHIGQLIHLKDLSLDQNKLCALPVEFSQLTELSVLALDHNNFSEFPSQLLDLQKLTSLALYNNNLTVLPPEITKLSNLDFLFLNNNKLSSLPSEFSNLKLATLDLSHNRFHTFPMEVFGLSQLVNLLLSGNSISSIPTEIAQLRLLKVLKLDQNRISEIHTVIIPFLTHLRKDPDLSFNRFSDFPPQIWNLIMHGDYNLSPFRGNPLSLKTQIQYREKIYIREIATVKKVARFAIRACAVAGLGYLAFQYPNEIIDGLPYVSVIGMAVIIQKLAHRYF